MTVACWPIECLHCGTLLGYGEYGHARRVTGWRGDAHKPEHERHWPWRCKSEAAERERQRVFAVTDASVESP